MLLKITFITSMHFNSSNGVRPKSGAKFIKEGIAQMEFCNITFKPSNMIGMSADSLKQIMRNVERNNQLNLIIYLKLTF